MGIRLQLQVPAECVLKMEKSPTFGMSVGYRNKRLAILTKSAPHIPTFVQLSEQGGPHIRDCPCPTSRFSDHTDIY